MVELPRIGLSPEQVSFSGGRSMAKSIAYNILRPEAVESIYMLHRLTNDTAYRDMGWDIFNAFNTYSKVREALPVIPVLQCCCIPYLTKYLEVHPSASMPYPAY
jgi:hypothetical protein